MMLVPTEHTAAAFRSAVNALSKGSPFSKLLKELLMAVLQPVPFLLGLLQ